MADSSSHGLVLGTCLCTLCASCQLQETGQHSKPRVVVGVELSEPFLNQQSCQSTMYVI
jgi:hypothetical protein